jgi:hypothetical protein
VAQGLLDCPVKPGNDSVCYKVPYPATVLHVFARFSAPRSDNAKTV